MKDHRAPFDPKSRLERLAFRAWFVLAWERLWPSLAAALAICGVFVAVSWLGLWMNSPLWARVAGCSAFALAVPACFLPLVFAARISRRDRLARLDRDSGVPHRPASALEDRLANADGDPTTLALWSLHRKRLEAAAKTLRLAPPSPRLRERDRYALRAAVVVAVVAAAFVAGPDKIPRLLAAFDWRTTGSPRAGFRLDAWIDPPAYTGRAPILLTDPGGEVSMFSAAASRRAEAPTGSVVVVRAARVGGLSMSVSGGLTVSAGLDASRSGASASPGASVAERADPSVDERRWTLRGSGVLTLRRYGLSIGRFEITALPDLPPKIALTSRPESNFRGSLTLHYEITDAYGVVGAEADFADIRADGRRPPRTLTPPPKATLSLPTGSHGVGRSETSSDFAENPWAGARVRMTLRAKDEAGAQGASQPLTLVLPQRAFTNPIAKALVEQRRILVLDPDRVPAVATAIDAMWLAPDEFEIPASIYLGLRSVAYRLAAARSDADLLATADLMWDMAVRIEDGDLADAERALNAARQQLQDALRNGASKEDVRKLTEQLQVTLDKFLQALVQQRRQSQTPTARGPAQTITPGDLHDMIDRMEKMAQSGDVAEAQRLLDQLKNLLQNLQSAQAGRPNSTAREMNRALNELDQMTRDQQGLRDRTFQSDHGSNGASRQALMGEQSRLRQSLEALQQQLKTLGAESHDGLDDAEQDMQDAERSLGSKNGSVDDAVEAQGRALQALRRGAQSLAQQMQQQGAGSGQAFGPGQPGGENSAQSGVDPLGRDIQNGGMDVGSRSQPLGASAAQRAQQVLEELRRRLGDTGRPQDELDYLERLLNSDSR